MPTGFPKTKIRQTDASMHVVLASVIRWYFSDRYSHFGFIYEPHCYDWRLLRNNLIFYMVSETGVLNQMMSQ